MSYIFFYLLLTPYNYGASRACETLVNNRSFASYGIYKSYSVCDCLFMIMGNLWLANIVVVFELLFACCAIFFDVFRIYKSMFVFPFGCIALFSDHLNFIFVNLP